MHYVMGDIHGNMRRFLSVLKQIDLQPEDRLYVLGDVVDRHPDGIRILQKLMAMPNAHQLRPPMISSASAILSSIFFPPFGPNTNTN